MNELVQAQPLLVERVDNHVYFYSDIDPASSLALIKALNEADYASRQEEVRFPVYHKVAPYIVVRDDNLTPIWLHIYSGGGDVYSTFAIVDTIKTLKTPVYSIVEGIAASGATVVAMACEWRYITSNSFLLIHQLSGMIAGTYDQMSDGKALTDRVMERLTAFYVAHSKLKRKRIQNMLLHDYAMDSEQAVKDGFADEIYKG